MRFRQLLLTMTVASLGFTGSFYAAGQTAAAAPEQKAAITGTVSDQAGAGIAGAVVSADNGAGFTQNATTDGQGLYAVVDLPAGAYTVSVTVGGSKIFQAAAVLSPSQVMTLGVGGAGGPSASAAGGKGAITGTVSDAKGAGIAGATVIVDDGSGTPHNATTDGQGLYALTDLAAATYSIKVTVSSATIFQSRVSLSSNQVLTLGVGGTAVAQTVELPAPPPSGNAVASAPTPPPPPAQAALAPPPAALQASPSGGTGSISGSVTDQTGAVLVGATVKVSTATGVVQTTTSDTDGNYSVKGLPPGSYTITVTQAGFKDFVADHVNISKGAELPLDAAMEPAGEKTEVTVEGQKTAQVETETSQVSGTITEKEVSTLGLNGRNFTQLIALTPGVSNQTGQDEAHVGVTGSVKYSVNGGRVEYNTFEVDGSDVLNAGLNGAESTLMVYPSLDAIQEVKVLTSNYGAMYGRTASGTVLVTTKSGGAEWHGNGYEFFRNEALNARNYFDETKKAPLYRRNDFGFTIGGPIKKDKTFIFWSEEFRFEKSPTDQQPDFNVAVPSLAERHGDFNDVCPSPNVPEPGAPGPGFFKRTQFPDCPAAFPISSATGFAQAFPNNQINPPGTTPNAFGIFDPNAAALLSTNLIPLPNSSTGCNSTIGSCYDAVISEPTTWREDLVRLDHNISTNLRLMLRGIHDAWQTTVPVPQWSYLHLSGAEDSFPTVQNSFHGPGVSLVARLTDTITPTLLNEVTASFTNSHITLSDVNGPGGANYHRPAALGQPGGACSILPDGTLSVNSCPMGTIFNNGFGGKAPGLVFGGNNLEYGGAGFAVDPSFEPWEHTNPTYSLRDDISKAIKNHTLQFGAQIVYWQRNETNGAVGAASGDTQGVLTFSNVNAPNNTGNVFANFLVLRTAQENGYNVNSIQSYTQDSSQYRYYNRYTIGEPFIQDDWRVNSRLTLNLGVRFSLFGLFHEKYLNAYSWEQSEYSPALAANVRVDPNTGQLDNVGTPTTPVPINPGFLDPRITNGIVHCGVGFVPSGCMKSKVFNPAPRVGFAWDPFGDGKTSIRAGYGIFYEHGTGQEANTGSLEGSAPLVLSMTQLYPITYGCIGGSQPNCPAPPGAYPLNVTSIPNQAVWPYAQQWSFSVQRQLPRSMVASIAYVGSKGTHLTVERQLNQLKPLPSALNPFGLHEPIIPEAIEPGTTGPGDCIGYAPGTTGGVSSFQLLNGTVVSSQDPAYINLVAACAGISANVAPPVTPNVNTLRPYPGLGEIFALQNVANSDYNALQATIRRTKGPLTVGASYSYSHSIDDSSDRSDTALVDTYDLRANRASSDFDERHLLNVSYIFDVPDLTKSFQNLTGGLNGQPTDDEPEASMPPSYSRVLHWLGSGWQFSGITIFQSGTPFSVLNGGSSTISVLDNAGVANGIAGTFGYASYPDLATNPGSAPNERNNTASFGPLLGNPNMFVAPRGLTFGDAGRNFLNNPHRINFDMSLLKHFPIKERSNLEFRVEAFNIFNHTQFRIYDPNLGNRGNNVISCYGGPNYSAGFSAPLDPVTGASTGTDCVTGSAFLHPVDAHRPRTVQLGAKYSF